MTFETAEFHYVVPQKDIYYISWIIDAAEGIGFLETNDAASGEITIYAPREQAPYVEGLIAALREEGMDIGTPDGTKGKI